MVIIDDINTCAYSAVSCTAPMRKRDRERERERKKVKCVNQHKMISGVLTHLFVYFLSFRYHTRCQRCKLYAKPNEKPAYDHGRNIYIKHILSLSLSCFLYPLPFSLPSSIASSGRSIAVWRQANIYHQIDQHALNYVDLTSIKRFVMCYLRYIESKRYKHICETDTHTHTHKQSQIHTETAHILDIGYLIC